MYQETIRVTGIPKSMHVRTFLASNIIILGGRIVRDLGTSLFTVNFYNLIPLTGFVFHVNRNVSILLVKTSM